MPGAGRATAAVRAQRTTVTTATIRAMLSGSGTADWQTDAKAFSISWDSDGASSAPALGRGVYLT
ncbi:hypothetical protein ACFCYH_08520 [Streptomyces sp. NPDC056400]|uniref:hypothetical protein n=1 Tax=Streptomyces sp. NPDC056400 TaxID=3345808 RepID=UPI0035DBAA59